jgi:hypothetical protein
MTRMLVSGLLILSWCTSSVAAPLVSQEQVSEAKTRAILWSIFAVIMLGVCIFQIVRAVKKKK